MAKKKQRKDKDNSVASDEPAAQAARLSRKDFEKKLYELQVELPRLQAWTVATGVRVIVVFEGRDTAGKGGVISRITARTSPRVFRHVALPAPSDREKSRRAAGTFCFPTRAALASPDLPRHSSV